MLEISWGTAIFVWPEKCGLYSLSSIDTFVIISGDSDFSPLVSKLRENAKLVIGVGVKNSTSDLLTNNCDEFIYYDDLVDDHKSSNRRKPAKKSAKNEPSSAKGTEDKIGEAIQLVLETAEGLQGDKGDQLWGSPGLRNAVYTPYPHREYGRGCLAHVRRHARTATGGLAGDGGRVYGLLADAGRFF